MYHEPCLAEMIAQSDGWAWAICRACHRRTAISLTVAARSLGHEVGILSLARKLRCACGVSGPAIAKPVSASPPPLWNSPEVPLEHPVDPEDGMTAQQRAAHEDPEGYQAWERLSRLRWYAATDISMAGAIRDVAHFLSRAREGEPFDWLYARRAINQLSRRDHYMLDDTVRAGVGELDAALRAAGETDAQRRAAEDSEKWVTPGPAPSGKPWKRRDH